jgi:hypothetical protein
VQQISNLQRVVDRPVNGTIDRLAESYFRNLRKIFPCLKIPNMANLMKRMPRPVALTVTTAAGLLMTLAASPSAVAAAESAAPECVEYYQSWRYTNVFNGCGDTVAVTVEYTIGQWAPCNVIEPGGWATFAGYGTDGNYMGLQTCDPNLVATSGA